MILQSGICSHVGSLLLLLLLTIIVCPRMHLLEVEKDSLSDKKKPFFPPQVMVDGAMKGRKGGERGRKGRIFTRY